MRWRDIGACWLAATLCLAWTLPGAAAPSRAALVIGVAAYRHAPPLTNPAHDARDIGTALRELGFAVTEAIDPDRRALEGAVRGFAHAITGADVALLYYAGHGLQAAGQNFLLPTDARLASERDLEFEALRLELLLRLMEGGREGKVTILLLDACRDNPLARSLARAMGVRSDAYPRGLAATQSGAGTFIAFSTQPGNVAYDGTGRNSPFAAALVAHMRGPSRPIGATMVAVRRDVMVATGGRQVPWDHSALTGDFYFRPAADGSIVTGTVPAPAPSVADEVRRQERMRRLDEELGRGLPAGR